MAEACLGAADPGKGLGVRRCAIYVAAHGCFSGSVCEVLTAHFGTDELHFTMSSPAAGLLQPSGPTTASARCWKIFSNARIYGGINRGNWILIKNQGGTGDQKASCADPSSPLANTTTIALSAISACASGASWMGRHARLRALGTWNTGYLPSTLS